MATIVVGVDGSDASVAALGWAVEEARRRGASLRVLHVWQLPALAGRDTSLLAPEFLERQHAEAERPLARALAHVRLDEDADDVEIESEAIEGRAASVLVEASRDADMLVVGSRGHGGFAGLLLGSVSQQCALHASCPVVIVKGAAAGG